MRYDLIRLNADGAGSFAGLFPPEHAYWAEPSIDRAADCMVRLKADAGLCVRLGEKARSDMDLRRRRFLSGVAFDEIEELVTPQYLRSAAHSRAAYRLLASVAAGRGAAGGRPTLIRRARSVGGRILRALRLRS